MYGEMRPVRKFVVEHLQDDLAVLTELQDDYTTRSITVPRDWLPPGACCGTYLHAVKRDQTVGFHPAPTDGTPSART
jgi:hypothetical protein